MVDVIVQEQETVAPVVGIVAFRFTELGNAERFRLMYGGKFLWTSSTGWLVYVNGRWQRDTTKKVFRAMHNVIQSIRDEAESLEDKELQEAMIGWASRSESSKSIKAALDIASTLRGIARDYSEFDRKPHLFNCANGTYNLETGEFGPNDPSDLLTTGSDITFDPNADCRQWGKFVLDVMDGNEEMVTYLQRCFGYSLSSDTSEHCMFVPYGIGGTGKSTFLNVMSGIMGVYCTVADPEMFMAKRGDSGQPFEMAGKQGIRALFAVETEEGKRLAQTKVKRMTGQDEITACYKFQHEYKFTPIWKIWLATNDRPTITASDDAIWDRVRCIPFNVKFRGQQTEVKNLAEKLIAEEGSGILNWALAGYRAWRKSGLQHPAVVMEATEDWRETEDYLQRFLDERTEPTPVAQESASNHDMFTAFSSWAESNKEARGINNKQFAQMMQRKGFESKLVKIEGKAVRCWFGLKLVKLISSNYTQQWNFDPH